MRSKKKEGELQTIKKLMENIKTKDQEVRELMNEKLKSEEAGLSILQLYKHTMSRQDDVARLLKNISDRLELLEGGEYPDAPEEQKQEVFTADKLQKEVLLSGLDTQIIQIIQQSKGGMATAEDVRTKMNYRGKNAASARLTKLHKMGILDRYQLGHKVYYKYDAGKATKILIVSPPQ